MLAVESLTVRYGRQTALDAVSFTAPVGSYVVLVGPSGSGKTTLLSVLGGFTVPDGGRVLLDHADLTDVPPARRPTATVFQDYALFPHMSVAANVAFGLRMHRVPERERRERVREALAMVGLDGLGERRIDALSGGQRQRVALARALVIRPRVLLLDEPLGALDMSLRWRMQEELAALQKRSGATFVHVTHDQEEAMNLGDLVVVMQAGRIEDAGAPQRVYLKPASAFVAAFMGESNLVDGIVAPDGDSVDTPYGRWPVRAGTPGRAVQLMIRPEHLSTEARADRITLACRVEDVTFQGPHLRCRVATPDVPDRALVVRLPGADGVQPGHVLTLSVDPQRIVCLPG
jgi:spermidine/putrescine transport system ATP-binding protein